MTRISIRELVEIHGVSQADIELAKITQNAQRKTNGWADPLAVICGVQESRKKSDVVISQEELLKRQRRRLGEYDQAALLLDRKAIAEKSPERAMRAREAAGIAKELSAAAQIEFDFFGGGNVSIAFQYQDAITERLFESAKTDTKAREACMILWTICRHLGWQNYECTKTATQLCEITRINEANMARALKLLEDVGAISRVKRGRVKVITVTPEGAFRGNVNEHGKTVERYKLDVIDGGKDNG